MARSFWQKLAKRRQSSPAALSEIIQETSFNDSTSDEERPDRTERPAFHELTVDSNSSSPVILRSRALSSPIGVPLRSDDEGVSFEDGIDGSPRSVGEFFPKAVRDASSSTDLTRLHLRKWEEEIKDLKFKLDKAHDELRCIICLHNKRGVMFSPCHHVVTCAPCAEKLPGTRSLGGGFKHCPLCRRQIEKRVKIFLG